MWEIAMRWQNQRRSDNVNNRRSASSRSSGGAGAGVIMMILRLVMTKFGFGGIVILVGGFFLLSMLGLQPLQLVSGGAGTHQSSSGQPITSEYDEMVSAVLGSTEDVWTEIFREEGLNRSNYPEPALNLFTQGIQSGCGFAPSAVGPFYCPADNQIYLDTNFFDELKSKYRAQGDFPPAYVIAHEVGHHIQTVLGTSSQVRQMQARASEVEKNQLQVRMELQADCYAGLWARRWNSQLDDGDIDEALVAAAAIGDDTLQRRAGSQVNPDSFTHGSSEQRKRWFMQGYQSGHFQGCDTFSASQL